MKLSTVRKLYFVVLLGILLLAMIGRSWPTEIFYGMIACVMVVYVVIMHKYWRCPVCGKSLGKVVAGAVVTCPHCKYKINL